MRYKGLTRAALDKITLEPMRREFEDQEIYIGWLYDDGTIPTRSKVNWTAFSARLEKLAAFGD